MKWLSEFNFRCGELLGTIERLKEELEQYYGKDEILNLKTNLMIIWHINHEKEKES